MSTRTSTRITVAIAAILLGAAGAAAGPGIVAYDGFGNGPRQDLAGSTGGEGWAGPWNDSGAAILTSITGPDDGLAFGDLAVTPGRAVTAGGWLPDMTDYTRAFPAIEGDVMYASFLLRPEPDQSNWYILRFGNYPAQVDVGIPIGYYEYGMMLGDGLIVASNVPAIIGTTSLLVLEILHDTVNNRTVYSLYVDPTPGGAKPLYPDADFTRGGLIPFTTWTELRGEGGYSLDELRISTTWDRAVPVPDQPCIADFDGSGALDIFDFLAFTNAFNAGDGRADVTGDGVFDLFDFLAFFNAFNAGC
jgi:hypothetical protein